MNTNKIILLIVLNFIFLNIFSQEYKLTGIIKNTQQNKLVFSKYSFNEKLFLDTINIIDNKISYNVSGLEKGMYNIENKDISIDFICNSENIDVYFDVNSSAVVEYKQSVENKIIDSFFMFYENNNLALRLLNQLEKYYPKSDDFYSEIIKKSNSLKQSNIKYIDSISAKYPNSFSSEILQLYRNTNSEFLDGNITYSTELKNTVFLGDLIISYLNKYQKQDYSKTEQENAFKPAVDNILASFEKNSELSIYVSEFMIDQFRYFDFDLISEYIALKTSEIHTDDVCVDDEKLKEKLNNIEALLNVKLGKEAPNFAITKDKTMHDIKSDYKIIVFWASWCPHCETLLKEMIDKQKDIAGNVKIITYSLDSEKKDWEKIVAGFPKDWINRCMCDDGNELIPDSYAVYSTPSIFLLDDMNTIIEKPKHLQEIEGLVY